MDKLVNITQVNPDNLQLQNYTIDDESLISNFTQDIIFNPNEDYLEYFVLDLNQNILFSNVVGYPNYKIQDNNILIDPQNNLELAGFTEGQYYTIYNFLKQKLSSSPYNTLYIQDISPDRTELRLNTTKISNSDIIESTSQLALEIANSPGSYKDFYLDFGDNNLIIATNIALDNTNPTNSTVLIKLYEPLPENFTFQSQCWVVEQIAESQAYQIELTTIFTLEENLNYIGGPNFNLPIQDQINNSTSYQNLSTLSQNTSVLGSGSLLYQINSILKDKGIEINIDYSDYSDFVHFSSAQTRLENFYYKLALLEEYTLSGSYSNNTPTSSFTSASQGMWDNKINEIITNFDGYEYYLYYTSESYSWPKSNSQYPYLNYSVNDPISLAWFVTQSISASLYDNENINGLINTIPSYLKEDPQNDQYILFVQMIGQHFDNVWIYLKDITNKFDSDNRLNFGISKDIVAQAIRDLGVKIYQNNFSTTDLYSALLGVTNSGSNLNIPFTTGSLPSPSGYEYINSYVTASSLNDLQPLDDVNKEIYKRIYHNLPYLLKKKGTVDGLRTLINIYGIPDTILRINEFGGQSSNITNYDNFQDQFNYEFYSEGTGYLKYPLDFKASFSGEFRFKTNGIPSSSISQVLLTSDDTSSLIITLHYTGSGNTSGSYSGSIVDPYNNYGNVTLEVSGLTSSVYLPVFDGDWWSVLFYYDLTSPYTQKLYVKNNIYEGYDGNTIGFQASSSFNKNPTAISGSLYLSYPTNVGSNYPFSGSFQEFRLYNTLLSESKFNDYVMNPFSIEGNMVTGSQSSLNTLLFRAPLGALLDNDSSLLIRSSSHSSLTSYPSVPSLGSATSLYYLSGSFTFEPNTEYNYQNQFNAGIKNAVSDKIRIIDEVLPSGDTLSKYISIQQNSYVSESFTKDVNYVEVAFSPQDEVNDDIIAQLGSFNIGNYIGDPRQVSSSLTYYPDFNKLRDEYFSKYTNNYNLWDYIRLIKFLDNSLFKMIQDFTPAKTGLATGIVIKQTILERNKYPLPQATTNSEIAFVGSPTSRTLNIPY